jgi:serine/threonine protein kinase
VTTAPALDPPLPEGATLAEGLTVIEHLSRNEALDVYDVWDTGRYCRCVAKLVMPDRSPEDRAHARLLLEGELLERFAHPHIVRAFETIRSPQTIVLLETLSGETLGHLIDRRERRRLPLGELAILGLQLGSAIRYMHSQGYLHLDVKPSNAVVEQGYVKLLDLSLARPPGACRRGVGTRPYLSPEQARGGELTAAADVWGLGATLYAAATGQPPFEDPEANYPQLEVRAPPVRGLRRLPGSIAAALDACLEPGAAERPSVDEVLDALELVAP